MARVVWDSASSALSDFMPAVGAFDVVVKLIESIHATRPKIHKERVGRLKSRITVLENQVQSAGTTAVSETTQLQRTRCRLEEVLEESLRLMEKLEDSGWIKRFFNKGSMDGSFEELNQRLSQESLSLVLSLNIDARVMQQTFNEERRRREDEIDRVADMKFLEEMKETLLSVKDDTEEIKSIVKETNRMVKRMSTDEPDPPPLPRLTSPLSPCGPGFLPELPMAGLCPYPTQDIVIQMPSPLTNETASPASPMTNQKPVVDQKTSPVPCQHQVVQMTSPATNQQPADQVTSPVTNQQQQADHVTSPVTNQQPAEQMTSVVTVQPAPVSEAQQEKSEEQSTKAKKPKKPKLPDFGNKPAKAKCQACGERVQTIVAYRLGVFSCLMVTVFLLFGCFCGCCLIPCFKDSCKDAYHTCPECSATLSVHKKISG